MTWLENEQDMTTVVLATIQTKQPASSLTERGVAGTAAEVDETALGEEDDVAARGHGEAVDLGLDVDVLDRVLLEPGDVNLDVKVADAVAESARQLQGHSQRVWVLICGTNRLADSLGHNGVLGHGLKVLGGDDVPVTGGGDEDVRAGGGLLHRGDLVTGHGGLEGVDGVDLGHEDTGTVRAERLGALNTNTSANRSTVAPMLLGLSDAARADREGRIV
jgi:hypothetical protein